VIATTGADHYASRAMPEEHGNRTSDGHAERPGRRRAPWGLVLGLLFLTCIGMLAAIYFVVQSGKL
jgi:hypothetical protein